MLGRLRTFLAVVRYQTFEGAGEAIGLTQGAVSAQIRKLEEELGAPLFDRTGRRAVLNEFGRLTAARAENIVLATDQLSASSTSRYLHERLTIACIITQSVWHVRALAKLQRTVSGIKIRVLPGTSDQLANRVDAGEIDNAIIVRPPYFFPQHIRWHSLAMEPFVMLVPESYTGRDWRKALASQPYIRYDHGSFAGRIVSQFLIQQNITVEPIVESDYLESLIEAVAEGMGVTIIPMVETNIPLPDSVRIISLEKFSLYREIGVVERVHVARSEANALLIKYLADYASRSVAYVRQYINTTIETQDG